MRETEAQAGRQTTDKSLAAQSDSLSMSTSRNRKRPKSKPNPSVSNNNAENAVRLLAAMDYGHYWIIGKGFRKLSAKLMLK